MSGPTKTSGGPAGAEALHLEAGDVVVRYSRVVMVIGHGRVAWCRERARHAHAWARRQEILY